MGRVMRCRRLARCVSTMVQGRSISGLTREKGSKRPRHLVLSLYIVSDAPYEREGSRLRLENEDVAEMPRNGRPPTW